MSDLSLSYMAERVGARLGNWNDLRNGGLDDEPRRPRVWRVLDRIAGWLYVRGER